MKKEKIISTGMKSDISGFNKSAFPRQKIGKLYFCNGCETYFLETEFKKYIDIKCPECSSSNIRVGCVCDECGELHDFRKMDEKKEKKINKFFIGESKSSAKRKIERIGINCSNCGSNRARDYVYSGEYVHKHHGRNNHPIHRNHRAEEEKHPTDREDLKEFVEWVMERRGIEFER